jgi:hypothetical protein
VPDNLNRGSRTDMAVSLRNRDRARVVKGWAFWPHTAAEVEGIRHFLATGDFSRLPAIYRPQLVLRGFVEE